MKRIQEETLGLAALLLCFFLAGCVAKQDVQASYSGFLGNAEDYALLKPVANEEGDVVAMRYRHPAFNLEFYNQILIQPTVFFLRNDLAKMVILDQPTQKEIATYFEAELRDAVGGRFTLTDQPGPRTLEIRPAISGVALARPTLSGKDYLPVRFVARNLQEMGKTADKVPVVFFEGDFRDSESGMRVGALVEGREGVIMARDQALTLEQIKPALGYWADKLRDAINDAS